MTSEKAEVLNELVRVENELEILWDFHPDNPGKIDVVTRFDELQRLASNLEDYLQTLWSPEDEE